MSVPHKDLAERAMEYCRRRGREFLPGQVLGFGVHGSVFTCRHQYEKPGRNAIKIHERPEPYAREREAYLRLRSHGVDQIQGHAVPQLIDFDDELLIIEMSIVARPFVLDFGGAYVDAPPDYDEEILEEWRIEKEAQFEQNWPAVVSILEELRSMGIHVADVNPGNISFLERGGSE